MSKPAGGEKLSRLTASERLQTVWKLYNKAALSVITHSKQHESLPLRPKAVSSAASHVSQEVTNRGSGGIHHSPQ